MAVKRAHAFVVIRYIMYTNRCPYELQMFQVNGLNPWKCSRYNIVGLFLKLWVTINCYDLTSHSEMDCLYS